MRHMPLKPGLSLHSTREARAELKKRRAGDRLLRLSSLFAISMMGLIFLGLASFVVNRAMPAFISYHASLAAQDIPSLSHLLSAPYLNTLSDEGVDARHNPKLSSRADIYLKGLATARRMTEFDASASLEADGDGRFVLEASSPALGEVVEVARQSLLSQARSLQGQALRRSLLIQSLRQEEERLRSIGAVDTPRYFELANSIRRFTAEREQVASQARRLEDRARGEGERVALDASLPSFLIFYHGNILRVVEASERSLVMTPLILAASDVPQRTESWSMLRLEVAEARRSISDLEVAALEQLRKEGALSVRPDLSFFTRGNSTSAERAGIGAALLGTLYALMVAMLIALPLGVAASLRLKELERKAWFARFKPFVLLPLSGAPVVLIGLFALVVLVQFFDLAPASPLLAGLVLGMVALPHVMAATERALSVVPPLRKEAAFALGASRADVLFHHVLPPSLPAIFSGALVAFASAIGQAAPLLVLGFVIFAVDAPSGLLSATTTLPVQIFIWADEPDAGFAHRAAAGIIVLLALVASLHLAANLIRARFAPKGASHG